MRKKFDGQLKALGQEMMCLGSMVEESIQKAISALMGQDVELAKKIMASDEEVDREQKKIEGMCIDLLMRQQPVARDLRVISAAMKMVTDMERIGDHASDIAEMTIMMAKQPYTLDLGHVRQMSVETMSMLIQSIEAYVEENRKKAQEVIADDDVVDRLFDETKKDLIELIHRNPECGEEAADMLMVAKYFERIGDHATNIAEHVIYSLDDRKSAESGSCHIC